MIPILLQAHTRPLTKLIFNRTGDLLFTTSKDSITTVWRSHNGERLGSFQGHGGVVWALACSADSERLITGSGDSTARIWAVNGGEQIGCIETESGVRAVAFSQDDRFFALVTDATMGKTAKVLIYDFPKMNLVRTIDHAGDSKTKATVVAFSDCNEFIITGHENGAVRLWDWNSPSVAADVNFIIKTPVKEAFPHSDVIRDLQLSADRSYFITASRDNTAKIIDTLTLTTLKTFKTERPVNSASISPLRNEVVIAGGQEAVQVTTTSSRAGQFEARFFHQIYENEIGRVRGHFGPINSIAYNPTGKGYASGSEDGFVRLHHFDEEYFEFLKEEPVFL